MLDALRALARSAGRVIMDYSATLGPISLKEDRSPLTGADLAADALIRAALAKRFPEIPVLSEEGEAIPYRVRRNWNRFWLIDPLDGTKEFIAGNGEFTVNIALVAGQRPVLGVVCVPAQDRVYYGMAGAAFMQQGTTPPHPIRVRLRPPAEGLTVVVSRSHPSPGLEDYLQPLRVARVVAVGSSLKLCMVAAGTADLYPRFGPTMEWDTAAGQAIVEAAGGSVRTLDGEPLVYNKKQLCNPFFIASPGPSGRSFPG